ncbi:beta-N-acetylglucosaminidase domain-containing protein [Streptomyces sp. B-S-A8]|uniref:Beta-N-acetylglucosaminidase domain-containing protein n=1 Tax=Streptomyces solicavernae TaxID=3043614 RepID=A0ABT6RRK6_9ACTN|nr:beta-N-acetylglucosaminidase domain-containing protein [Streptomyces sp. B-S-A8]MDI3387077.1 beta-N-acetylglucosaminidase domain-containing protein [Streptomyces sp. B-S-A8]
MQMRRRKRAAAIAAAVIGGLIGGAPGALAAPPQPAVTEPDTPATTDRASDGTPPQVWPRPQQARAGGQAVRIGEQVYVATDAGADPYAVDALRTLLRQAGARRVTAVEDGARLPTGALLVRAGEAGAAEAGPGEANAGEAARSEAGRSEASRSEASRGGRSGAAAALRALRADARADLPSGGYRLAVGEVAGRPTIALEGVGADGLFHGVQTLRQLITDTGSVPGVRIRDWPGTGVRGLAEGFYGTPWTREQRLEQLDFMGRSKLNRYVYAPGDDPYRKARWREPYPAEQRAGFRALAERAARNHVTLTWAVAPGQAMCLSSDDDLKALLRKVDAMWALGVRAFQLQFQDVSYSEWHCEADAETFGSGPEAAAAAQSKVAGALAAHLRERYEGAEPLTLMPTEYFQDGATDYREALAGKLDDRVQVAWTGVGVVPKTITGRELAGAREAFGHPLVTMDNYPVNDYAQDRIFLGPYMGREPGVATGSAALLANAMEQPVASRIPLFTAADYAWNPKAYRPQESWRAAVDATASKLADGDRERRAAVRALAGNTASSVLGAEESAYLRPLMDAFWRERAGGDRKRTEAAGKRLRDAFTVLRETPQLLRDTELGAEVAPWSEQLGRYGAAGEAAVDMLLAQTRGDGARAWRHRQELDTAREEVRAGRATVGKGVLGPFLDKAEEEAERWSGTAEERGEVAEDDTSYTVRLPRARPIEAVTAVTEPGVRGTVQAHVPGEGWRTLGRLTDRGWTETAAKGLRADAVRTTVPAQHVVPWFADGADAAFELSQDEADAEIGGPAQRVTAKLTARRPADVQARLTARAPKGVEVRVPREAKVPRGTDVSVPVEITVPESTPAGSYAVPVSYGGQTRTLTVHAHPRTGGPDLARGARASSSGDETPDFPARAANDGDPETRWSSPAEDDAWWQAEFERPVRLGKLALHWQDAYASGYRVKVSEDGEEWRTAAEVQGGRGGRETVRMDERDVRFVRIEGEKRGTRFGYSLWAVEAYAVRD